MKGIKVGTSKSLSRAGRLLCGLYSVIAIRMMTSEKL